MRRLLYKRNECIIIREPFAPGVLISEQREKSKEFDVWLLDEMRANSANEARSNLCETVCKFEREETMRSSTLRRKENEEYVRAARESDGRGAVRGDREEGGRGGESAPGSVERFVPSVN